MDFIKKNLNLLLNATAAFFGLLVLLCMIGGGAVAKTGIGKFVYSCYEVMSKKHVLEVSGGAIAGLIFTLLVLVGAIALLLFVVLKKDFGFTKFVVLGLALCAFAAAISFFCVSAPYDGMNLGAGAVFAGIFSLLTAGCLGFEGFLALTKKSE